MKLPITLIAPLLVLLSSARAGMPLLEGIADASKIGPATEAVDLSVYQHVIHVAPLGTSNVNASFPTLEQALSSIQDASENNRYAVLVHEGSYSSSNLRMKSFVDLFGGFGEGDKRDIWQHSTILDGGKTGPVVLGANQARLDGFVITNGQNRGHGGGIVCEHVSPVISNNIIRGNATIEPENYRRDMIHQKGNDGGGVALLAGSNAEVRSNLICENTTAVGNGGGIAIYNESKPRILNNVICDNHNGLAGEPGKEGSRASNGGGISVSFSCAPEIIGNLIAMNTAIDTSDGGGIYLEYDANAQIRGNWIVGNFAVDDGGGMYVMKNSEPVLERNVFAGNRNASGGSGAIRLSKEGRLRASNNLLVSNSTGIDAVSSWMILKNNTFVDCMTNFIVFENQSQHYAPSQITGNIFYGPTKLPIHLKPGPADPQFSRNLITGGFPGEGNVDADPKFIDDSVKANIAQRRFDPARYFTVITVSNAELAPETLAGRIVNIGQQWSVVQSNDSGTLTLWGNISDSSDHFLIVGTYQLPPDSSYADFGSRSK